MLSTNLSNIPTPLYACILVDEVDQTFEIVQAELMNGRLLGNALGGDYILRQALNAMSTQFWTKEKVAREECQKMREICQSFQVGFLLG